MDSLGNRGTAIIKINDKIHRFNIAESNEGYFTVPIQLRNGIVTMELIEFFGNPNSNEVDLSLDNQRFYSRSEYNGEVMPFEWIMRFYYTEQDKNGNI